jgi:hypothetical protein
MLAALSKIFMNSTNAYGGLLSTCQMALTSSLPWPQKIILYVTWSASRYCMARMVVTVWLLSKIRFTLEDAN